MSRSKPRYKTSERYARSVARRTQSLSHHQLAKGRRKPAADPDVLAQEQADYAKRFNR